MRKIDVSHPFWIKQKLCTSVYFRYCMIVFWMMVRPLLLMEFSVTTILYAQWSFYHKYIKMSSWTRVSIYFFRLGWHTATLTDIVSYKIWSNSLCYLWTDLSKDVVMLKLFTRPSSTYSQHHPDPWWSVFPSQTNIVCKHFL